MLIRKDLIEASVQRWQSKTKSTPERLARTLGEGERSQVTPAQREMRMAALMDQTHDPVVARTQLERIIEGNDLTGINYLAIGLRCARSICRVHLRDGAGRTTGFGTGFMVGPGLLLTNHHVISSADEARGSLAEFQYEYDLNGVDRPVITFRLLAEPPPLANESLDFCLVAVAPKSVDGAHDVSEFGWLPLDPKHGKSIVGEYLTVIQHPAGERKQLCARENKLIKYDEGGTTVWYNTDTAAGSSGSPVFNDAWQVAALHHSGVPATNAKGQWLTVDGKVWDQSMDETQVKWIANEGIRISAITQFLATSAGSNPLARAALQPGEPPTRGAGTESAASPVSEVVGDELRLTIPVRVSVRLDSSGFAPQVSAASGMSSPPPPVAPALAGSATAAIQAAVAPRAIEKVIVKKDYGRRNGYDPEFLGTGKLAIPLPTVTPAALKKQVVPVGAGRSRSTHLDFWNYSVILNKSRKLAFLSALNVNGALSKGKRDADGDVWFIDPRVDKSLQLGPEFYGEQKTFEVSRVKNPFDRGHLSSRNDCQWGKSEAVAKRNGDDSFHWVNCSPQHYLFNHGQTLWAGLEVYVISTFAKDSKGKASVFNGPIFDAPLSSADENGYPVLNLHGKRHKDPVFGGVSIPKMFFKVVAAKRGTGLAVAAFIISQEDLLATVKRISGMPPLTEEKLTTAQARAFQVSVKDVARLTGLNFGPLVKRDTIADEALGLGEAREIKSYADIATTGTNVADLFDAEGDEGRDGLGALGRI